MAHLDVDAAVRRGAARPHLAVDARDDDVARGALAARVVVAMKRSPLPLSRWPPAPRRPSSSTVPVMRVSGAGEQAGGMELHHLHVAQRQAGAQRHGEAVQLLSPEGVW